MTKPQHLNLRLTEPQFDSLMAAVDLYQQTMVDNMDAYSASRAQTVNRAGDALQAAWTRAVDGF